MGRKLTFVTRKIFNDGMEKVVIKKGYLPNPENIQKAKKKKAYKKQFELQKLTLIGQLSFDSETIYKRQKADFERKYAPKLENAVKSMNRAKNNLMDILRCNDFNFFVTLTFDKSKIDRLDDNKTRRSFTQWVANIQRDLPDLYYVAVPEYHKKGGLHFHLLIGGVLAEDLSLKDSGKVVKSGRCKGQTIYNVGKWDNKGFSTATKILDINAVKYYLSKYLTKGKVDPRFFGKKRFYVSRNINRPQVEKMILPCSEKFDIFDSIVKDDYNIDYEDSKKEYCVLSRQKGE